MLDGEDLTLLRELQRRAYGRGDALNEAEAETLRALQTRSRRLPAEAEVRPPDAPDGVVPGVPDERAAPTPLSPVSGLFPAQPPAAREEDAEDAEAFAEPASLVRPPGAEDEADESRGPRGPQGRRRALLLGAVAAVAALLVGLGIGWAAFGRDDGPSMTAEQHEAWKNLEASGDYDAGSLRFVGAKYRVSAWEGTKNNGEMRCIVLTARSTTTDQCQSEEEMRDSGLGALGAQINVTDASDGNDPDQVFATLAKDVSGETVLLMQRVDSSGMQYDWRSNFSGGELAYAESLVDSGYTGDSLTVVGYADDAPIWMGERGGQNCLVAILDKAGGPMKVGRFDDQGSTPSPDPSAFRLMVNACDVDQGEVLQIGSDSYGAEMTQRGWVLVITRGASAQG